MAAPLAAAGDIRLVLQQERDKRRLVEETSKVERLITPLCARVQLRVERQQRLRNLRQVFKAAHTPFGRAKGELRPCPICLHL